MRWGNCSVPSEFVLLGFSSDYRLQVFLCLMLSLIYLMTLVGNLLIMAIIWLDTHLHTPMYYFLGQLSFLDICYSSVTVPKMLKDSLLEKKTISFEGCITQIYFFLSFGGTECVLLAAMAYDRYLAICHPLHYTTYMNKKTCFCLVVGSWMSGFLSSMIQAFLTARLPFCGSNIVNHLFCEVPPLLKLSYSSHAYINEGMLYTMAGLIAMGSFLLTMVSYVHIIWAIKKNQTRKHKAFTTCTSHLTVVSLFFGAGAITYLVPHSSHYKERNKLLALLYAVVTPMLNPIIYSLRNMEIKEAIRKVLGKVVGMSRV